MLDRDHESSRYIYIEIYSYTYLYMYTIGIFIYTCIYSSYINSLRMSLEQGAMLNRDYAWNPAAVSIYTYMHNFT